MRSSVRFPLTPALSPSEGERGKCRPPLGAATIQDARIELSNVARTIDSLAISPIVLSLSLRGGEGRGEGASAAKRRSILTRRLAAALCLFALAFLSPYTPAAESRLAPNFAPILDPEKSGAELAARLRSAVPPEPAEFTGKLEVTTRDDIIITIPIRSVISPRGSNWVVVYHAFEGAGCPAQHLTITHTPDRPNSYTLATEDKVPIGKPGRPVVLVTNDLVNSFARSDFWFCDLGLEFLHWPQQRVLTNEMRRSRSCWVLQSATSTPAPGGYARVLSWIDVEHEGILRAEAYDPAGKQMKEFKLGSFRKVDGRHELESMKMRNLCSGSESEIKFDLKSSPKGVGE